MKPAVLITSVALAGALAAGSTSPASAQALASSPSTTFSTAKSGEPQQPEPTLAERRALALAAFERQPIRREATAQNLVGDSRTAIEAPLEMKDEWTDIDGVRVSGARLGYKARF